MASKIKQQLALLQPKSSCLQRHQSVIGRSLDVQHSYYSQNMSIAAHNNAYSFAEYTWIFIRIKKDISVTQGLCFFSTVSQVLATQFSGLNKSSKKCFGVWAQKYYIDNAFDSDIVGTAETFFSVSSKLYLKIQLQESQETKHFIHVKKCKTTRK